VKKNSYTPQLDVRIELTDPDEQQAPEALSPEEIAAREAEKKQLVAGLREKQVESRLDLAADEANATAERDDSDFEHLGRPTAKRAGASRGNANAVAGSVKTPAPELVSSSTQRREAAEADVAEADEELARVEAEIKAEEQAQREEKERRDREQRARLDVLRQKKSEAQQRVQAAQQEQERAALGSRTRAAQDHSRRQKHVESQGIDVRTIEQRKRVQPCVDAVRRALRELQVLVKLHDAELAVLSQTVANNFEGWNSEARIAWNNTVPSTALTVRRDLHAAVNSYGLGLPELERLLASRWQPTADWARYVNNTLRYSDPETVNGVVAACKTDIARLSTKVATFDLPEPAEPSAWRTRELEQSSIKARSIPVDTGMPGSIDGGAQTHAEL
jgi:hypothetical protein